MDYSFRSASLAHQTAAARGRTLGIVTSLICAVTAHLYEADLA